MAFSPGGIAQDVNTNLTRLIHLGLHLYSLPASQIDAERLRAHPLSAGSPKPASIEAQTCVEGRSADRSYGATR
jgi:hypothetical protein